VHEILFDQHRGGGLGEDTATLRSVKADRTEASFPQSQ